MGSIAQGLSASPSSLDWFRDFLKEELSPYPGRGALVTRMVVAATIVMIIHLTFQIPFGAYAVIYTLNISRENPKATVKAAKTVIVAFACSVLYILVGALCFLEDPILRLFWVIGTLFVMFFALSAINIYGAAARFGYMLVITIPLWDELTTATARVEGTLWAFEAISVATIITVLTELVFAELNPHNYLVEPVARRLAATAKLLNRYAAGQPVDPKTEKEITHLAMTGTSRLRRDLQRSGYSPRYAEQMGAVVVLAGRLVDLGANLLQLTFDISENDRKRIGILARDIAGVHEDLLQGRTPAPTKFDTGVSSSLPLLREMETTFSLISDVFTGTQSLDAYAPQAERSDPRPKLFASDALSNPEHLKFALRGCLAASLCYIIYNGKDWPGISTAVSTCFLTALTTVGSSHQKQILRFAGAIVGGAMFGIGSQMFVLPYLDNIGGFTMLFLAVTIPAAWIATSGPRLSYFGVQIGISFYLINLSEFKVQTSLEPARDRIIGVLLGLAMMWLVFDRLWAVPAVDKMKRLFISTVRLLAQFAREPLSEDPSVALTRSFLLRENINKNLETVRTLGDGVALEFGPSRAENLAWRSRIIAWQTEVRILFLTEVALWKYRSQLPSFELPAEVRARQKEFDDELARVLERFADRVDGKINEKSEKLELLLERLAESRTLGAEQENPELPVQLQTFLSLCRRAATLTTSLQEKLPPPAYTQSARLY
jgi:multidrug resistance protein MdtO